MLKSRDVQQTPHLMFLVISTQVSIVQKPLNHIPLLDETRDILSIVVQVVQLLWHEAAQKTGAGQQRRKEALEHGLLDIALQGVQSNDAWLMEPYAGGLLLAACNISSGCNLYL